MRLKLDIRLICLAWASLGLVLGTGRSSAATTIGCVTLGGGGGPSNSNSYQLWGLLGQPITGAGTASSLSIVAGAIPCRRGGSTTTPTDVAGPAPPRTTRLSRVAPNPSLAGLRIDFDVASPSSVELNVFDASGRRVAALLNGPAVPGHHSTTWDGNIESGSRAPAGVYFVRFHTDQVTQTRRVSLVH